VTLQFLHTEKSFILSRQGTPEFALELSVRSALTAGNTRNWNRVVREKSSHGKKYQNSH